MFKKFAAIGLSAALALSPLAAIAQTDHAACGCRAAPAASTMPAKAPMKSHKTKSHKTKKHTRQEEHGSCSARRSAQELIRRA